MVTVVVLADGDAPRPEDLADLDRASAIVVADGGVAAARRLGIVPSMVIGDLDSALPGDLEWARSAGAAVLGHPPDKDQTDLELALAAADALQPSRIVVVGAAGGRTDHELGNWCAVTAPLAASVEVRSSEGTTWVVRDRLDLAGAVGATVSIIAWGGPAVGVSTTGLRWGLRDAELSPFEARGVSNEMTSEECSVTVRDGVLLVVRPVE